MSIRTARSILLVAIELIAGYAAAAIFVRVFSEQQAGPSLPAVAAIVLAATAISYLVPMRGERDEAPSPLWIIASALAIAVVAQAEFAPRPWSLAWVGDVLQHGATLTDGERGIIAGIAALMLLWLRGAGAASRADRAESALTSVIAGLVAVALAAMIAPSVRGPDIVGFLAIAYVPLALLVLAAYQVADPDQPLRDAVGRSGPWLAALIGATIAVAVLALLVDPGALGVLEPLGGPLGFVVRGVLQVVLAPFALLVGLLGHLPSPVHHNPPDQPQIQEPAHVEPAHGTPAWQVIVGRVIAGALVAALVAAVLALIWFALRRRRPRRPSVREWREDIAVDDDEAGEGGGLRALFDRFRRPRQPAASVAVRRLYHAMLADAASSGIARPVAVTPAGFAPRLDAHYRSDAPSAISDAFSRSRYGAAPFDDADVDALRSRWTRARDARGG
jgi:hypothetical protein